MSGFKLKLNTSQKAASPENEPPSLLTPGGFKLSFKQSQPPTPATEAAPAPKAKKQPTKKRPATDDPSPAVKRLQGPSRKISIKVPTLAAAAHDAAQRKPSTQPKLRALTTRRAPPPRLPGLGYDSEDSEAEVDPAIQQAFVLRMVPGEDCDLLHKAIAEGKIGASQADGGVDVSIKFFEKDPRRGYVKVRGRMYAAVLVDLPCIVETMKSWDKKGWWKVADLCQMLLVLGQVQSEDEARTFPLPTRELDKETMQFAHGLTPPMHWVRKRRFRKRLSHKTVANVEEEVERLLREDDVVEGKGGRVSWEVTDPETRVGRMLGETRPEYEEEDAEEDEAMETIENGVQDESMFGDEADAGDLEEHLQAMLDEEEEEAQSAATPAATNTIVDSPAPIAESTSSFTMAGNVAPGTSEPPSAIGTPAADITQTEDEADDDDEDTSEDDDDEADSPDVMDEDAAAKAAERNQQLEEVADLEREIADQRRKRDAQTNQLLKQRADQQLRALEEDLRRKKEVFGLGQEEDGEDLGEESEEA